MAKPRIFISSTYYDLKIVRDDLDRFIKNIGYEPIRHETSGLSYGMDQPLENYAYKEIDLCDMLVCIIGGRYGATSDNKKQSITQNELTHAIQKGKQVYIFIEENVLTEYHFYTKNKDNDSVNYLYVDNIEIYKFIEKLYDLPRSNPIFPFKFSSEIVNTLTDQWAGLFQRFLSEAGNRKQGELIDNLTISIKTVEDLIKYLNNEKGKENSNIEKIIFYNHPFFHKISSVIEVKANFYFKTINELDELLFSTRYFARAADEEDYDRKYYHWQRKRYDPNSNGIKYDHLIVSKEIFDENEELISATKLNFTNDMVRRYETEPEDDDEIPF